MKEKKLNFCIDIDGTLTHPGHFIPYLNKHFNKEIKYEDITVYDFGELYDTNEEELKAFFHKDGKGVLFHADLLDGAQNLVLELAEKHNVCIVTARKPELCEKTREWLDMVGLKSIELHCLGTSNKRPFAEELGCDYFFEDHPTASVDIADAGISVLLMDAPYNQQTAHENMKRIYNWGEIRSNLVEKGIL